MKYSEDSLAKRHTALKKGQALKKGKSLKNGKKLSTAMGSKTGALHAVQWCWKKWEGWSLELGGFSFQLMCCSASISTSWVLVPQFQMFFNLNFVHWKF